MAFGELVHGGSRGQLTITTISPRQDGSAGKPHTRAFLDRGAWSRELRKARHATGHHFSFSTYTGACPDGASTGATVQNTLELTAFYQDLDWHNHPIAKTRYADIYGVLAEVDRRCASIGFIPPKLVNSSGRGLLVAWPHQPVPAYWRGDGGTGKVVRDGALVRWNVVQAFLREFLSDLGADAAAIPACHFFKLPGTVNPKNAVTVWAVRQPCGGGRDSFSNLYKMLEPTIRATHERGELRTVPLPMSLRKSRPAVVVDLAIRRAAMLGQPVARRGLDGLGDTAADVASLIWAPRLRALVKLAENRAAANGGMLPAGYRDNILFAVGLAMAWASRDWWWDEFLDLAQRLTPWNEGEVQERLSAIVKRAREEQGDGTGLYMMSSEHLRGLVGLTDEEEDLDFASPIASPDAQRRHSLHRLAERRRTTGRADREATTGSDRAGYIARRKASAAAKAARAHELHREGCTTREIAAAIGVGDPRSVRRYLASPVPTVVTPAPAASAAVREASRAADASLLYRMHWLSIADGLEPHEIASRLDVPIARVRAWLRKPVPGESNPAPGGADSVGRTVCFLSLPARRAKGNPGIPVPSFLSRKPFHEGYPGRGGGVPPDLGSHGLMGVPQGGQGREPPSLEGQRQAGDVPAWPTHSPRGTCRDW